MKPPKVTNWVLSPHALARVQERQITALDLSRIIENPDIRIMQGPKWIFAKHFTHRADNKLAAVLLERKERDLWVVVTVMVHFQEK